MANAIILKRGYKRLTEKEYRDFSKGDTIWRDDSSPEELKRWSIEDREAAEEEIKKYSCTYQSGYVWDIEEYALEFCDCDESGDFIQGSDYALAEEG